MTKTYLSELTQDGIKTWSIDHPLFKAEISSFGAHVLSFIPNGEEDLLWLSTDTKLDGSKAIRGGIPLCWPWFGPGTGDNLGKPQHGYARIAHWQLEELTESPEQVVLKLAPDFDNDTKAHFEFDLCMTLRLSKTLDITLHSTNRATSPQELSQAIHTYFAVDNINTTKLNGLEHSSYLDKLTGNKKQQSGAIVLSEAADRVYLSNSPELVLQDGVREIRIGGSHHDSVVVWNPWIEGAKNMGDFADKGYLKMICVEMANTQGLMVEPNQTVDLTQSISIV